MTETELTALGGRGIAWTQYPGELTLATLNDGLSTMHPQFILSA